MRRLLPAGLKSCATFVVLGVLWVPGVASAQQSLNLSVGGFVPRGFDARSQDDVLLSNDFLAFDMKDFNGPTVGAEWLAGLGDKFEAGLGVGFYKRSVPAVYLDYTKSDRSEIEQNLNLRVVPITATVRFLPLGRHDGIVPYLGAGVGVFAWRYSETGEFLATDLSVIKPPNGYAGSGSAVGPVILGGVRVPLGSWGVGGEIRYQSALGDLPTDQGFSGTKIDLGGLTYSFTVNVRF